MERSGTLAITSSRHWGIVIGLLSLATIAGLVLEPYVSLTSQAMIYVLVVVLAAYKLEWIESAVCAVGAVTALNFFFVPPRWTFEVESQEHFIALTTMLVVALVISRLASGLRRETEVARLNEQRARQLQALATELSSVTTPQQVQTLGRSALDAAFAGPNTLVLADSVEVLARAEGLAPPVLDGMRCCMKESAVLGPGTGRWPGLDAWYLPLGGREQVSGAACIRPALAADEMGREHAQALCALLAQALWRLRLTTSMLAAQGEAQRQQLQSTFLAAISHDLRTPLAAIVGAASALQTQHDKLDPTEQTRLLDSIASEASYLNAITENTLQMVRLASPGLVLRRDWESMEEIVGAVLARMRPHDPDHRIRASVPKGLPLVRADPVLLSQLVGNLLDNALKHGEGTIDLTVSAQPQQIQLCVADHGLGIALAEQEDIFKPYARGDRSGRRGAGLGLAVCRAIAQAHGGRLTLQSRAGEGSIFCLVLPLDVPQPMPELP
ncbi:MAG: sensor histidine kinase [Curvibacter sp. PD_MW3]|nr:MAG: sensor histidine kinase [Curvibacter sp. PD_MW3]